MINDPELGSINFMHSERAKHIKVRILSDGLKVSLPINTSQQTAMTFIDSIRLRLLAKQAIIEDKLIRNAIVLDENTNLQTYGFSVELKAEERKNIFYSLNDKILKIEFPKGIDISSKQIQSFFWNGISYFLRKDAKIMLPKRTEELASQFGFTYFNVKIQSSKTRWGSCSGAKNINFSLYLLLLPMHLIDYVILHELCHTKEMNHGVRFWKLMNNVTDGKSKELRTELKKYSMPEL
jgi:predicted metal-dependent hydrolase